MKMKNYNISPYSMANNSCCKLVQISCLFPAISVQKDIDLFNSLFSRNLFNNNHNRTTLVRFLEANNS